VSQATSFSVTQLVELLGATLIPGSASNTSKQIHALSTLENAKPESLAFCANKKFIEKLSKSDAGAFLVSEKLADQLPECASDVLLVPNAELSFAKLTHLFNNYPQYSSGVAASAVIDQTAQLGENVCVAANAVIEANAVIGDGCVIGPGSVVGQGASLGKHCRLFSNVNIYHGVVLGDHCIIHSGTAIGSDGFGFVPGPDGFEKLYQLGTVLVGNRVEMGANCTIDRGALGDTIIGNGVKMGNQVHIAHNVEVGENTAFAGCVGVAGSTKIGANCQFGGQAGVNGHIEICDGVIATGQAFITNSITEPGIYSSGIPVVPNRDWRRTTARHFQLDEMAKAIKELKKKLQD
jgi:UDP-3-O-[3-hydroxymyristoyl] glucosamine N-acyltransferase